MDNSKEINPNYPKQNQVIRLEETEEIFRNLHQQLKVEHPVKNSY